MLKILKYKNRNQIVDLFSSLNHQTSWLVSDLRTKLELQTFLLDENGFYLDESVLRASDLWKILLKRLDPEIRLVSDSFARASLRTVLEKNEDILGLTATAEPTVFAYMDQMAAVIFHPQGTEKIEEWLNQHPDSKDKWRDWYLRARFCAMKLLKEQGILTQDWVAAYLQNFGDLTNVWQTPLVVDLGAEISRVEAELLLRLSKSVDITVLQPDPEWKNDFHFLLQPYEDLASNSSDVKHLPLVAVSELSSKRTLRFSGLLAEIKNAVGQVRSWQDKGVSPSEIAIIAPDIEVPWPILQVLLTEEGIPVQKDVAHKLQGLPSVTRWLANLRSRSGHLSPSDLEIVFYSQERSQNLRYEKFKSLYQSLFDEEDMKRNEIVERVFLDKESSLNLMIRDEFVARALLYWDGEESDCVQIILRELLQNASSPTQWTWKEWLNYLESIAASKEYSVIKGQTGGVTVTRIMSAHSNRLRYRIFLGLTDESMKVKNRTLLSGKDYYDLAHDIGFYLDNPEQSNLDFELRLLADSPTKEDVFSFGVTDLQGSICSPAQFWMSQNGEHEILQIPLTTRWDELQQSNSKDSRRFNAGRGSIIDFAIDRDLGVTGTQNITPTELPRISASSLERFLDCPFIFAAEKHFRLKDFPEVDLDVDHRTRGQIAHALFEVLSAEPRRYNWTEFELDKVLEDIKVERELVFADSRLWMPLKKRHVQLGLRFLEFEKAWATEFPNSRIQAVEKRFSFYLDPKTEEIHREPKENCFHVVGQIDRIDCDDKGQLAIIDYKSSSAGLFAAGSWIKKNKLQLLFYMWVLEKSLVEDIQGDVIAAFYYIFKNFSRKGFKIEELAGTLFAASKRKDASNTQVSKDLYLKQFSELLMQNLDKIFQGEISPKPVDTELCKSCEWRRQCRAPHLM